MYQTTSIARTELRQGQFRCFWRFVATVLLH